jgi:hypothetical protein
MPPNEIAFSRRRRTARAASGPETGAKTLVERTRPGVLPLELVDADLIGLADGHRSGAGMPSPLVALAGQSSCRVMKQEKRESVP